MHLQINHPSMKKLYFFLFISFSQYSFGQNLVPNPSFEIYDSCPTNFNQLSNAIGWSSYRSSPDYFNACSAYPFGVPSNAWGYQMAFSGNAYAIVGTYDGMNFNNYREFIGCQLLQILIPGTKYYVSAYISRCDNFQTNAASNNFGFKLSTIPYSESDPAPIDNFSNVHCDSIVTDSINWVRISGSFIADSAYQYLIIGNFYDDQHTDSIDVNNNDAGYYVDAVDLSLDSLYDATWTGLENKVNNINQNIIFPNPANNLIHVNNIVKNTNYVFTDCLGRIIKEGKLSENEKQINVSSLNDGIYLLNLNNQTYTKILINH